MRRERPSPNASGEGRSNCQRVRRPPALPAAGPGGAGSPPRDESRAPVPEHSPITGGRPRARAGRRRHPDNPKPSRRPPRKPLNRNPPIRCRRCPSRNPRAPSGRCSRCRRCQTRARGCRRRRPWRQEGKRHHGAGRPLLSHASTRGIRRRQPQRTGPRRPVRPHLAPHLRRRGGAEHARGRSPRPLANRVVDGCFLVNGFPWLRGTRRLPTDRREGRKLVVLPQGPLKEQTVGDATRSFPATCTAGPGTGRAPTAASPTAITSGPAGDGRASRPP